MQINPFKVFKLNLSTDNIEELIGKAKLIKELISTLPDNEIKANKDEFIAFSNDLNELLEDIDEILMKKYIKELDLLFEIVNSIIETISDKLGEYAVKDIIIKSANDNQIKKDDEFMSFDEVVEALNEN
jgi:predicted house-cleaning noncanonical NTP pyrophosphatase (MazG superfamily)